ncbi:hypothetical protein FA95DRAFT_1560266, partial [Auriscalpium vulgare]
MHTAPASSTSFRVTRRSLHTPHPCSHPCLLETLEDLVLTLLHEVPTSLPDSLRHVGFLVEEGIEPGGSAESFVPVLAALPRLRLVTATSALPTKDQEILRIGSLWRDFEFVVYPDPTYFQRPQDFDWI